MQARERQRRNEFPRRHATQSLRYWADGLMGLSAPGEVKVGFRRCVPNWEAGDYTNTTDESDLPPAQIKVVFCSYFSSRSGFGSGWEAFSLSSQQISPSYSYFELAAYHGLS